MSALGRPRLHLRSTDSTNDRARRLAIAGAPHGTLVTASLQTAGRGRQGRRWIAPAHSSVLMSLILRSPPPLLPLIAAVAVCDVAGEDAGGRALIKWPNDVVVPRANGLAKLAGILAEGRPREGWAILGIGLNVALRPEQMPAELRERTATLGYAASELEPTLLRLLDALERRLTEEQGATLTAWRALDALSGSEIVWGTSELERGRAEGIDGTGRLVVALPGGGHTALAAGEVHLRDAR